MLNASKTGVIKIESKKKNELLCKDENRLSFEDMMKIIFSILPSSFGESDYYGNIKNKELSTLFILREIRNSIIHPKGIEDFLVSLKSLNGKDINEPMIKYIETLRKVINVCASKLKDNGSN